MTNYEAVIMPFPAVSISYLTLWSRNSSK